MRLFLDSSALAKRFITEKGTETVIEKCSTADEIAVSVLCIPEVISACNRLIREDKLTVEQYEWIKQELKSDIEQLTVVDLVQEVIQTSIECLEKGSIRTLDALHIASAVEYGCDLFLTADSRQCCISEQMGLKVQLV